MRLGFSVCIALLLACAPAGPDDADVARGRGLKPALLPAAAEAGIYEAAARATFDASSALVLRLHPQRLARTAGWTGGDSTPASLVDALRARGVIAGTCSPERDAPRNTPRCQASDVGYLIRGSEVLRGAGDTVQFYLAAEGYGPATGPRPQALRLEKVYQLVGAGDQWRVVREARARTVE